jgi:hypothetical protein
MKRTLLGFLGVCVLLFSVVVIISTYRSTNKEYICSGDLVDKDKTPRRINVHFELKNEYSGIPWDNRHWLVVRLTGPKHFYASNNVDSIFYNTRETEIKLRGTEWDKNLTVFASHNDGSRLFFDFKTKILEHTELESASNLLCQEII